MIRVLLLAMLVALSAPSYAGSVNVGSKRFTESYILGEILTQTVAGAGEAPVTHQQGLGNTAIVFSALKNGAIDLYPEYTGTVAFELLGYTKPPGLEELRRVLAAQGLGIAIPLGFSNTYALAMSGKRADELNVTRMSDLARHPGLRFGLSQEFLNRKDGWPAVSLAYALPQAARGLDHGLAYEALAAGQVDVIDVYTTDAKIARYGVRVLTDDLKFSPPYDAVVLYRLDFPGRFPRSWAALQSLENRISTPRMAAMNAQVELDGKRFSEVAQAFLASPSGATADVTARSTARRSFISVLLGPDLGRLTFQHLELVLASLIPAVAVGLPLGIWAARSRRASPIIMALVGLMQTVPALALLAFLITLMGRIGPAPAIVALFLYGLLPIVRNTASGLSDLPGPLRESATALGLPAFARLRRIELPLASRSILAGIKTSAVIGVGTATIAAFIGAGGYGERIVSGLAVNDTYMLLAGAVPAAVLALAVQWMFDAAERWLVPEGLRLRSEETGAK
ncbi:MAG TPA: glycine betaine ABC transporter substrate-binding protein [Burkholderiales bacterium]|nr:glycine betaine ABC transporter substrate-binding protein [Burkholderiales bacterium]